MSFGFSPSDIVALITIVSKAYNGWKDACGEYSEITGSLDTLLIVLERIRDEASKPGSVLLRTARDKQELKDILYNAEPTVRELHTVVVKHKSLGSSRQKNWDRLRFGTRNLGPLRAKLTQHIASINTYLDAVGLGTLGRIERDLNAIPVQIQQAIDGLVAEIQSGRKEGTVMTAYSEDNTEIWKQFRRELIGDGVKSDTLYRYKPLIIKHLKELADRGELEELPPEEFLEKTPSLNSTAQMQNSPEQSKDIARDSATQGTGDRFRAWDKTQRWRRTEPAQDRTNTFRAWQYMQKESPNQPAPTAPSTPDFRSSGEQQIRSGLGSRPSVFYGNPPPSSEPALRKKGFDPNALGPDEKAAETSAYSRSNGLDGTKELGGNPYAQKLFPPPPRRIQPGTWIGPPSRPAPTSCSDQVPYKEGLRSRTPYSSLSRERTSIYDSPTPSGRLNITPDAMRAGPLLPPPSQEPVLDTSTRDMSAASGSSKSVSANVNPAEQQKMHKHISAALQQRPPVQASRNRFRQATVEDASDSDSNTHAKAITGVENLILNQDESTSSLGPSHANQAAHPTSPIPSSYDLDDFNAEPLKPVSVPTGINAYNQNEFTDLAKPTQRLSPFEAAKIPQAKAAYESFEDARYSVERLYNDLDRYNILLIDFRSRQAFDAGHIFARNIICIDPIQISHGMSADQILDRMVISPEIEQDLFMARDNFESIIYYDETTQSDTYLTKPSGDRETKLKYLHEALVDFNEKPLQSPPCLLVGGIQAWIDLLGHPSLVTSSTSYTAFGQRQRIERRQLAPPKPLQQSRRAGTTKQSGLISANPARADIGRALNSSRRDHLDSEQGQDLTVHEDSEARDDQLAIAAVKEFNKRFPKRRSITNVTKVDESTKGDEADNDESELIKHFSRRFGNDSSFPKGSSIDQDSSKPVPGNPIVRAIATPNSEVTSGTVDFERDQAEEDNLIRQPSLVTKPRVKIVRGPDNHSWGFWSAQSPVRVSDSSN